MYHPSNASVIRVAKHTKPKHIGDVLPHIFERLEERQHQWSKEAIESLWADVVGENLAAWSRPVALHDACLTIDVRGSAQLFELKQQEAKILSDLQQRLGTDVVQTIRLRAA